MNMFKSKTTIFHEPRTNEVVRLRLLEKSDNMTKLVNLAIKTNTTKTSKMFAVGTKTDIDLNNLVKKLKTELVV